MVDLPTQPVHTDEHGVIRFVKNTIVRRLLDEGGIDLNDIARWADVTNAEHQQFAQLIGYSVSGYGDLSYVDAVARVRADAAVDDFKISPLDAELEHHRRAVRQLKEGLRPIIAELYDIHPDDLSG